MRQEAKWVLVEGKHVKQWQNVMFCNVILHHQTYISHPAGLKVHHSQTPLPNPCILSPSIPPESCRQVFILKLIKASGTAFHLKPCRPLSPRGCQAVYYYQTIRDGKRTWLQGVGVELGKDFVWQTCWVCQQIICASLRVLSQPLLANLSLPLSLSSSHRGVELLFSNVHQPLDSTLLKV